LVQEILEPVDFFEKVERRLAEQDRVETRVEVWENDTFFAVFQTDPFRFPCAFG
jgi:hypothetical protein